MNQSTLFESMGTPAPEWVDVPYMVRPHQVEAWVRWLEQSPHLVLDYETDGLEPRKGHKPFMIGAYSPDKGPKVADLRLLHPNATTDAYRAIAGRAGLTIVHNAKNELCMTPHQAVGGALWDNQAASFALDERRQSHGQKQLCELYGIPTPMAAALRSWMQSNLGDFERGHQLNPNSLEVPYSAEDVESAWHLYVRQRKEAEAGGLVDTILMDSELCRPVTQMEQTGIRYNMEAAARLVEELTAMRARAYKAMMECLNTRFDPASHRDLFGVLYGTFSLPMHSDVEKMGKLDDDVLSWMLTLEQCTPGQRAFIEAVRDWRECDKLLGTYLLPWLYEHGTNGILYPHLNLTVADTRRFTADSPNLQNIPARTTLGKKLRKLVVDHVGFKTYSYDYSQIEYRVFVDAAKEPRLLNGYKTDRKFDLHAFVAKLLNTMAGLSLVRDDAKHLNFGILYGMGIDKLSRKLGVPKDRAKAILDAYMSNVPSIRRLKQRLEREVSAYGYVKSALGGRRHLTSQEGYKALNTYCQMTAADIIRHAMVRLWRTFGSRGPVRFLLQVHDELLFDLPVELDRADRSALAEVQRIMEYNPAFDVPMLVEGERFAPSWGEKEVVT